MHKPQLVPATSPTSDWLLHNRNVCKEFRLSVLYLRFNIIILFVLTGLVVWVIIDGRKGHVPRSPLFITLELFCMTTIVIDVFTDVLEQGCAHYWSGYEEQGAEGERGFLLSKCIWNYAQFFTLLICLTLPAMLIFSPGPSSQFDEMDEVFVGCLTFVRYFVYVTYLLLWARKGYNMQKSVEEGKVDFDEPEDSANEWDSPRAGKMLSHDTRMSRMALQASPSSIAAM
jgi:hypothetical protein